MLNLFKNVPRDRETVAALRKECDERGFATRCRERVCQRAGRCRGPWRADVDVPEMVLPPCLLEERIEAMYRVIDAELAFVDLRRMLARARRLPNPEHAAECDTVEPLPPAVEDPTVMASPACLDTHLDLAPPHRGASPHASVRTRRP